jgi:hypothetical protein
MYIDALKSGVLSIRLDAAAPVGVVPAGSPVLSTQPGLHGPQASARRRANPGLYLWLAGEAECRP